MTNQSHPSKKSAWQKIITKQQTPGVFRLGVALFAGVVYWLLDAVVTALITPEIPLKDQLIHPNPAIFWQRTIAFFFIIIVVVNYQILTRKRERAEAAQKISEEKYRALVEGSGQAIFILNRDGMVQFVNFSAAEVLCSTPEQLVGQSIFALYPEETAVSLLDHIHQTLAGKREVKEYQLGRNGRARWFELNLQPLTQTESPHQTVMGIATEITQRKQIETDIRRQNKELAILNNIIRTVSQSLDLHETINNALDEVLKLEMFGQDANGIIFLLDEENQKLVPITQRDMPENHPCQNKTLDMDECACGTAAKKGEPVVTHYKLDDITLAEETPPNIIKWEDIAIPIQAHGRTLGVMNIHFASDYQINQWDTELLQSIAEQIGIAIEKAKLYEEKTRQQMRLRDLTNRASEAEEAERKRLARELHDQVGQSLTALGINLKIISSHLPPYSRAQSCIAESQVLLETTTEAIRNVMSDLRPPMLDDYGLLATLHWYGSQIHGRTGIKVNIHGSDKKSRQIPLSTASALFRITQEALNNTLKHANASQINISLIQDNGTTRLEIIDDGQGFDTTILNAPQKEQHWGYLIMSERAEAIGGKLSVQSRPQHGTSIIVEIPS